MASCNSNLFELPNGLMTGLFFNRYPLAMASSDFKPILPPMFTLASALPFFDEFVFQLS